MSEFGGDLIIDKSWAKSFIQRLRSDSVIPRNASPASSGCSPLDYSVMDVDSESDTELSDLEMDRGRVSMVTNVNSKQLQFFALNEADAANHSTISAEKQEANDIALGDQVS